MYPSVVVEHGGEQTTISLQWYDENRENVKFISYAIIFLYKNGSKKEIYFQKYDTMIDTLKILYEKLKK